MDDEQFILNELTFEDYRQKYRHDITIKIKEIEKDYAKRHDSLKNTHIIEFENYTEHEEIINLCVHPFSEHRHANEKEASIRATENYHFIRAEPLSEKGVKNVDFLIYKETGKKPVAIFGEVKGSVTNFTELIREIKDKKDIIKKEIDYVNKTYLKTDKAPICEYVLAVPSGIGIRAMNNIWKSSEKIILWTVELYKSTVKLGEPPLDKSREERARMQHCDHDLTKALADDIRSMKNTYAVFPQSHTLRKLMLLALLNRTKDNKLYISISELREKIGKQMFYLTDTELIKEVDFIVKEAKEIGFLSKLESGDEIPITSKYKNPKSLTGDLKQKWITHRIQKRRSEDIENIRTKLQEEFREKQRSRPTLFSQYPLSNQSENAS